MRVFNQKKIRYARPIDAVGRLVFRLFKNKSALAQPPLRHLAPQEIIVLESHLIGDVILAIPALQALRAKFRSSRITLVSGSWAKELLDSQNVVDEFVEVQFPWSTYDYSYSNLRNMMRVLCELRRHRWDLGIDMRGDFRNTAFLFLTGANRRVGYNFTGGEYLLTDVVQDDPHLKHIVDYNLHVVEELGCTIPTREPSLLVAENEIENARRALNLSGESDEAVIGIHPGASKPLRHWKAERFAELADMFLDNEKNHVLLFRGPGDEEVVKGILSLMKRTPRVVSQPLYHLPAIFKCCNIIIGLDSGAVHIAAAVDVPTVVLFGPADPERVKPISDKTSIIIQEGYWCRPCDQVNCMQPDNNCMDALQVKHVYLSAVSLMEKSSSLKKKTEIIASWAHSQTKESTNE